MSQVVTAMCVLRVEVWDGERRHRHTKQRTINHPRTCLSGLAMGFAYTLQQFVDFVEGAIADRVGELFTVCNWAGIEFTGPGWFEQLRI